jgi:hypothetical protein
MFTANRTLQLTKYVDFCDYLERQQEQKSNDIGSVTSFAT